MKRFCVFNLILFALFFTASFSTRTTAQQEQPANPPPPPSENQNPRPEQRPNLLRELDLSPDQIRQIRRLNQERKPQMQAAQQRLREATKALDEAIYGDTVNEADIQTRMKAVQLAQAEVIKNRTLSEYAVRKVLTPEQLVKFRELRGRFLQRRENSDNQMPHRLKDFLPPQPFKNAQLPPRRV